ncbi:hypothetical protein VTO73DRAFT_2682 [Trametes versicolor]
MPRFLNTLTGEFEWYNDPRKVIYAILSHTWRSSEDGGEQSFGDVQNIQSTVAEGVRKQQVAVLQELQSLQSHQPSMVPRTSNYSVKGSTHSTIITHPKLSNKIKGICTVARKAGFRLIWSDACCIDKTSSAELSEAINSMYEWYRLSDMCYVYLEDVPDDDVPTDSTSYFCISRWHDRGWTLQELIAPERVEFLTQTWHFLGTKIGLASTLENITGVNFDILTGRAPVDSVSVARRMSWAAERETTRIEDRAYSLMGLFGVHMSPIYGEGNNAFLRLQEEIIRKVPDQSIFAWGNKCLLRSLHVARGFKRFGGLPDDPGLLASSPSDFQCCRTTTPVMPSDLASRLRLNGSEDIPPLHCVFTPQGVRVHLLCLSLAKIPQVSHAFWKGLGRDICPDCKPLRKTDVLALLQCEDTDGSLVALPLYQLRGGARNIGGGSLIGTHIQCTNWRHKPFHVVRLTKEALEEALEYVAPVAMEVSLLRQHSRPPMPKSLLPGNPVLRSTISLWPGDRPDGVAFRLTPRSIEALQKLGFSPSPLRDVRSEREILLVTNLAHSVGSGTPPGGALQPTVQLRLTLTWRKTSVVQDRDTKACFSIVNIQSGDSSCETHTEQPIDESTMGRWRTKFNSRFTSGRTFVQVEFVIPSHPDRQEYTREVRLVRLTLERSLELSNLAIPNTKTIWLSIEVSEKYRYNHLSMRVSSGVLSIQTSDVCEPEVADASNNSCEDGEAGPRTSSSPLTAAVLSAHSARYAAGLTCEPTSSRALSQAEASGNVPEVGRKSQSLQTSAEEGLLSARNRVEESPRSASTPPGHARPSPTLYVPAHGRSSNFGPSESVADTCIGTAGDADAVSMDAGGSGLQGGGSAKRATDVRQSEPHTQSIVGAEGVRRCAPSAAANEYARSDSVDALRRENDALVARTSSMSSQIADLTLNNAIVLTQNIDLSSRVAALSAQNAVLSSQMAMVLARLDAFAASELPPYHD